MVLKNKLTTIFYLFYVVKYNLIESQYKATKQKKQLNAKLEKQIYNLMNAQIQNILHELNL